MAFDSFYGGVRRRRGFDNVDPYSDAARFPSLAERDSQALSGAVDSVQASQLGGPGSIAARFDPRDQGSIFSRQFAGAAEGLRDQQRKADPSNLYYNGGDSTPGSQQNVGISGGIARNPLRAVDRYAADLGYDASGKQHGVSFNSFSNTFDAGSSGLDNDRAAGIRRRRLTGSTSPDGF